MKALAAEVEELKSEAAAAKVARDAAEQQAAARPSGRAAHAACWLGEAMLVFGGRTAEGRVNDAWLLDGTTAEWCGPRDERAAPC